MPKRSQHVGRENSFGQQRSHESLKLDLPGTSVGFSGAFMGVVNCAVRYFVDVGNQKGVGVQVGVDRDVGCAVEQGAKIAEAAKA